MRRAGRKRLPPALDSFPSCGATRTDSQQVLSMVALAPVPPTNKAWPSDPDLWLMAADRVIRHRRRLDPASPRYAELTCMIGILQRLSAEAQ